MSKTLTIRSFSVNRPVSYRFDFETVGWAILTINNETGEVHIQSDFGNYQHRWHPPHTGKPTMHHFFADASPHYLVDKFSYGDQPDLKSVFDEEGTREHLLGMLASDGMERLNDEVEEWVGAECELALCPSELSMYLEEPWQYVRTKASARRVFLTETLVPFLQQWVRDNVLAPKAAEVASA